MTDQPTRDGMITDRLTGLIVQLRQTERELAAGEFDDGRRRDLARTLVELAARVVPDDFANRVETAAMLLHERRHQMGHGQVCDGCRDDAAVVLSLGQPATEDAGRHHLRESASGGGWPR